MNIILKIHNSVCSGNVHFEDNYQLTYVNVIHINAV